MRVDRAAGGLWILKILQKNKQKSMLLRVSADNAADGEPWSSRQAHVRGKILECRHVKIVIFLLKLKINN